MLWNTTRIAWEAENESAGGGDGGSADQGTGQETGQDTGGQSSSLLSGAPEPGGENTGQGTEAQGQGQDGGQGAEAESSGEESEHEGKPEADSSVPENPDGYSLPDLADDSPAQLPDGISDWFKQKAHENGLTNDQARNLWASYIGDVAESEAQKSQQRVEEMRQESERSLRQEWGNAFDEKLGDAKKALQTYGGDGILEKLDQTGLGNDPDLIRMFAQVGETLREDKVGGSTQGFAKTPEQAQKDIQELRSDKSFMQVYMDRNAPGHEDAVERMERLYKEAHPGS